MLKSIIFGFLLLTFCLSSVLNSLFGQKSELRNCSLDIVKEVTFPCIGRNIHEPIQVICVLNKADIFLNFEPEQLKSLLQEYPTICLEITQTKHPDETIELAAERMKNFELHLKNAGFDMSRLTFSYDFYTISKERLEKFLQPKIEFVIGSFDCAR
jgi:hypothetical protein